MPCNRLGPRKVTLVNLNQSPYRENYRRMGARSELASRHPHRRDSVDLKSLAIASSNQAVSTINSEAQDSKATIDGEIPPHLDLRFPKGQNNRSLRDTKPRAGEVTTTLPIGRCRVCRGKKFIKVLSLGNQYVSDFITSTGDSPLAPLELVRCGSCNLIQLRHTFPRGSLYRYYWYRSGISNTMRDALADIVSKACDIVKTASGDLALDIGCNDGTLLRTYNVPGLCLVGFEPAVNLVEEARKGTSWIFNDFFSSKAFKERFGDRKAKIITSVAMFYDLEDPNAFVQGIAECLAPDGIWVVQQNYLATMLDQDGFDNIGHEHLEYYSLETMSILVERHRLEVFDVETNDVNGGSFRTYICHQGRYPITRRVSEMQRYEDGLSLSGQAVYERFARNIRRIRSQVRRFIMTEVGKGKTVYVYGASNRGNTILQYCGLNHTLIKKATDANPEKWGRKTVGTLIPIVPKEEARRDKPDYFLILPHHFLDEIRRDEEEYLERGGRFIVPLPDFRIVTANDRSRRSHSS